MSKQFRFQMERHQKAKFFEKFSDHLFDFNVEIRLVNKNLLDVYIQVYDCDIDSVFEFVRKNWNPGIKNQKELVETYGVHGDFTGVRENV